MTIDGIETKKTRETMKLDVAKKIRELLNKARESYGADAWDEAEAENEILACVTGDDE